MTVSEQERPAATTMPAPGAAAPAERLARPALHRWIWYAFGGALPERNRAWVLHDTTTATWWLRHIARMLVQLAIPIALLVVLVPAPLGLRWACAFGGVVLSLIFSLAYMDETTENRVVKAGYPAGTAQDARERAGLVRQQKETERKRAAAAKRAARYQSRIAR